MFKVIDTHSQNNNFYVAITEKATNRVGLQLMKTFLKVLINFSIFSNDNLLNDWETYFPDRNFPGAEVLIPDLMLELNIYESLLKFG